MENNENDKESNSFQYTYSAKEQAELKKIREKYISHESGEENKMERLIRLDKSVAKKASVAALVIGIIGSLILGFGMSLAMTDLGTALSIGQTLSMIIGIPTGIFGGIVASLAYPVYNLVTKISRKKIAPEIIKLTDELIK